MKHLRVFIGAMTQTLFTSVVGWTLNIITFVALWVSVTFQSLPLWVWVAIAVVNISIAMFLAWKKERQRAEELQTELDGVKNLIPEFKIHVGDIKKYSIKLIIESTTHGIDALERSINDSKKLKPLQSSAGGLFGSVLASVKAPAIASFMPDYESDEDKLERLKAHRVKLIDFNNHLADTYQISLSIESTRHDKNVEVEISSDDTYKITVQDDYEIINVPSTMAPGERFVNYAAGNTLQPRSKS